MRQLHLNCLGMTKYVFGSILPCRFAYVQRRWIDVLNHYFVFDLYFMDEINFVLWENYFSNLIAVIVINEKLSDFYVNYINNKSWFKQNIPAKSIKMENYERIQEIFEHYQWCKVCVLEWIFRGLQTKQNCSPRTNQFPLKLVTVAAC